MSPTEVNLIDERMAWQPPTRQSFVACQKNLSCIIETVYFLSSVKCENFIKGNLGKGGRLISDTQDHNYKTLDEEIRENL